MRSNDLARLAGISVRTLRHYHQVGVLEEPSRSSNGYRDYDTHALVRVLRIRRIADLGFSLAQISTMMSADNSTSDDLLAALDAELAQRIEHLNQQRELLAHLRLHDAPPDLLPEIAAPHDLLKQSGMPQSAAELDRDHALLLAQVLGEHRQGYVAAIYGLLTTPDRVRATADALTVWADLGDEGTDDDIDELAQQLTKLFAPALAELALDGEPELPDADVEVIQEHATGYITDAQARLLERLRESL